MVNDLESLFPVLSTATYRVTSPKDRKYNCIAWAAGDPRRWWWPNPPPDDEGYYWPAGAPHEETVATFVAAFATLGFAPCEEDTIEPGQERIALFAIADGAPTHAARQLATAAGPASWAGGKISSTGYVKSKARPTAPSCRS
jgi:hypothetical protein